MVGELRRKNAAGRTCTDDDVVKLPAAIERPRTDQVGEGYRESTGHAGDENASTNDIHWSCRSDL